MRSKLLIFLVGAVFLSSMAKAAETAVVANDVVESVPEISVPVQEMGGENSVLDVQVDATTSNTLLSPAVSQNQTDRNKIPEKAMDEKKVAGRTCQQSLDIAVAEKTNMLDLTKVSDFAQNGLATIQAFLAKVKETDSFGTHSKNVSIDLTETGVGLDVVSLILEQAKLEGFNLILNLSFNESIGDDVLNLVDSFENIFSIFLRDTNISDVGVSKLCAILETSGIGKLHTVDISGTKVTNDGVKIFAQKLKTSWETKNPGTQCPRGILIFDAKKPPIKKQPVENPAGQQLQQADQNQQSVGIQTVETLSPLTASSESAAAIVTPGAEVTAEPSVVAEPSALTSEQLDEISKIIE